MIRIIDNKKVDLTNSEFELFNQICKSYDDDRRQFKGQDLFKGLFETDDNGLIVFLRPPQTLTSMEVYMFLVGVMIHQHLGTACDQTYAALKTVDEKMKKLDEMLGKAEKILK